MGLCKCPKRKVTNLFCFEHRVNVCEFCLVDAHSSCIVQSYLQWLQDSDYDSNCALCTTPLPGRDTIRLQCLHVYHFDCLDAWARQMPPTTAPAGFRCPQCSEAIFPTLQQQSPLIEKLRSQLSSTNWARVGLGLPILPELDKKAKPPPQNFAPPPDHPAPHVPVYSANYRSSTPATVLDVDDAPRNTANDLTVRKKYDNATVRETTSRLMLTRGDADDATNKYKRRPVLQWVGGLLRNRYGESGEVTAKGYTKATFLVLLAIMAIITIYHLMNRVNMVPDEHNPMFDPMANPNIRVGNIPNDDVAFN